MCDVCCRLLRVAEEDGVGTVAQQRTLVQHALLTVEQIDASSLGIHTVVRSRTGEPRGHLCIRRPYLGLVSWYPERVLVQESYMTHADVLYTRVCKQTSKLGEALKSDLRVDMSDVLTCIL